MKKFDRYTLVGLGGIIGSAVLFGLMPLFTKMAYAHGWNMWTVSWGRFAFGAVMALAALLVRDRSFPVPDRGQFRALLPTAAVYATVPILLYGSYNYIASGLATTLNCTYPVFVILLGALFCGKKATPRQLLCLLLCLAGTALLYTPGGTSGLAGIVMGVLSAVGYAGYVVLSDNTGIRDMDPLCVAFYLMLAASVIIGAAGLIAGQMTFRGTDAFGFFMTVMLALTSGVLALTLYQIGIQHVGGILTSLLSTFEPVTGVIVGILVFEEMLTGRILTGVILIIISTVLLVLAGGKPS
ncbi:MAG: DMT family transporter [Lachnospiraceae bacterium]|nr:DMT family transporter [Lachnospiraceae bacterium]